MNEIPDLSAMTTEQLAEMHVQTNEQLDELKAAKEMLDEELDRRLSPDFDSDLIGEYEVKRNKRVVCSSVSLDEARKYGAVKTEEKVDTTLIGNLYKSGTEIEGVRISTWITVKSTDGDVRKRTNR